MSTDRFDAMAGEWDAIPSVVQSAKLAAEFVAAQIEKLPQKPASALEFGCGTGLLAFMLADHIPKIDGLDSSNGMVEQFNKKAAARNVSDRIHAFYMDLTESGQLKDTYDVIFSNLAFHHVEDIAKMSRLLGERLNPGGLFIAVDFSKTDFSVLFHPPDRAEGVYHHGIDATDLETWAKSSGQFSSVSVVQPAFHVEKDTIQGVKNFPFLALVARKESTL